MLNRDLTILKEESVHLLIDGVLDGLHLLGDDTEHLQLDSVELIEATPSAAARETLEEFTHGLVVEAVGAVEHDTLPRQSLRQILYCLGLASSGRSLRSTTVVQVNGTAKSTVAPIGKWRDDETGGVTEILVVVLEDTVDDLGPDVVILPVVAELGQPFEVGRVADLLLDQIFFDDILGVHIEYNKSFESCSL